MKTGQVKRELSRLADEERVRERTLTDERHVDRTAALAAGACRVAARRRGMSFPAFVARQIRYTGRHVWVWQGLLLVLILSAFHQVGVLLVIRDPEFGLFFYRRLPLLLCGAGVLSAWSCVPFFARSGIWRMAEVEAASASWPRLRTAQLLIAGGSAVLMELGVTAAACLLWDVDVGSLAAWLFLPFLLAWDLILFLLDRGRGRHFAVRSSAVLGAGFLLFAFVWKYVSRGAAGPQDDTVTSGYVWILCGAAALLWILQIRRIGRKETDRWSCA